VAALSKSPAITTTSKGSPANETSTILASNVSAVPGEAARVVEARSSQYRVRGVLPQLEKHLPAQFRLLDPERKTLVWGAAPVDNMGKIGDKFQK